MSSHHSPDHDGNSASTTQSKSTLPTRGTAGLTRPRGGPSESSLMVEHCVHRRMAEKLASRRRDYITIDIFPDEILLKIFAFYLCRRIYEEEWHILVHVCRRWRSIVFESPLTLNLRIVCTGETDNEELDIWPAFPIIIRMAYFHSTSYMEDNLVAAFKHRDRICEIYFYINDVKGFGLSRVRLVMEAPFPALTVLDIWSDNVPGPFLSDSFLGGSAPGLRSLHMQIIGYRALPKLLSSAPGLIHLHLTDMLDGLIPPEEIVDSLSLLTRLEQLEIRYQLESFSVRASRPPPPLTRTLTRTVLPALTSLAFSGKAEYLDHFFAHTHFPQLKEVDINFFGRIIFDVSHISRFIGHTETFEVFDQAYMLFNWYSVDLTLSSSKGITCGYSLILSFEFRDIDSPWYLQSWARNRDPLDFDTFHKHIEPNWTKIVGNAKWLELLGFFTAVESLYLSLDVALFIAPALQELATGEGAMTEVLPVLKHVFIEGLDELFEFSELGPIEAAIEEFVAARELSGHSVVVERLVVEENAEMRQLTD